MNTTGLLGGVIGDMIGSTRERHNVKTEDFELLPRGSRFTDDTVMTLAVAEWLCIDAGHSPKNLVRCMQHYGRKYINAGYGGTFIKWLLADEPRPYGSFGNGSAMRVSPVGWYARSLEEALDLARITASVSHDHPEGIKGAQAIAACIYLNRTTTEGAAEKIKAYVEGQFGYDLSGDLTEIREHYGFDVTCQGSVPIAIMAYLQHPDSAEKAVRLAVSMGGDSDTIACMTASIVTAAAWHSKDYQPFSVELIDRCRTLMPEDLLLVNDQFMDNVAALHKEEIQCYSSDSGLSDEPKCRLHDAVRGCLMGGAVGDALGYPVEFMSRRTILSRYGNDGIMQLELQGEKALISDDTQMTLFTGCGLLVGLTRSCIRGISANPEFYAKLAYSDWYYTQNTDLSRPSFCYTWLRDLPELCHRRAPGITCLTAVRSLMDEKEVVNNSKGCGGIMRVAPAALLFACHYSDIDEDYVVRTGENIAKLTHRHPLGYLPAGLLSYLLYHLVQLDTEEAKRQLIPLVRTAVAKYCGDTEDGVYLAELTEKAVEMALSDMQDADAIEQLGEGWVAEETWAIAVYCAIRHKSSMKDAIVASVNHDGDSDSTGSVTGNIMGAIYGYEEIKRQRLLCPEGREFGDTLELFPIIKAIADDLHTGCVLRLYSRNDTPEQEQWSDRYCYMKPTGIKRD